jgi:NodT family efflux transporter outer membrane factor (OMF) lipoprotein
VPDHNLPVNAAFALKVLLAGLAGLTVAGCATVPNAGPAATPRAAQSMAASASLPGTDAPWPDDAWWTAYQDQQLSGLIEEGLRNAPDMAVAVARFRRANADARAAAGALLPTLDASAQATVDKQSTNNGFPKAFVPRGWQDRGQAAVDLDFDIDLWGRNRAALAAATSEAKAAAIDARQARLSLSTGIATAYADFIALGARRTIAEKAVAVRAATLGLVRDRVTNGLDTRGTLRQAEANDASARATLAASEEALALTRNRLAALVGAGPDRGISLAVPDTAALMPRLLPADVTTDLISRRPDIAAARARLDAAASRVKVAHAGFFPSVRLNALIGVQALGLDNLASGDSTFGSAGPSISLPIFRGGAILAKYRAARAGIDEAVAFYDRTVIDAYRDVADAVTSQSRLGEQVAQARRALDASEEAYRIARLRYTGGLSTYLDVLVIEERLLQARQAHADISARMLTLDIALVRALGGGFTASQISTKDTPDG